MIDASRLTEVWVPETETVVESESSDASWETEGWETSKILGDGGDEREQSRLRGKGGTGQIFRPAVEERGLRLTSI